MRHDSHYVDALATPSRSIGKTIPIEQVEPNPDQPRREFGDLSELTSSIKEKGVLEPLLVTKGPERGKYMIIAGERRWRASKLAGLKEVPCIEMDLDENGVAEIALIENLQRKDLTVWEEADGLAALAEKFGYTHDEIAKKISKSRSTVTEFMTIAGLPPEIRKRCHESMITSKSQLLDIARQFDEAAMFEYLDGLQNGTAKSKKTAPKAAPVKPSIAPHTASNGTSAAQSKPFKYFAFDDSFEVEVRFREGSPADDAKILKALKEAFDSVKEGRTS
jgi:ParB family chromosome partitioning protein